LQRGAPTATHRSKRMKAAYSRSNCSIVSDIFTYFFSFQHEMQV
jgi:hypothetical protein